LLPHLQGSRSWKVIKHLQLPRNVPIILDCFPARISKPVVLKDVLTASPFLAWPAAQATAFEDIEFVHLTKYRLQLMK
jgi:hypothetical protein